MSQRWALRQHSCKGLSLLSFHVTIRQLEFADASPDCHHRQRSHHELVLCLFRVFVGVVPEAPAHSDNDSQEHLVHYLFDFLRGPSQHDRPSSRQSPAPVVCRDVFQSSSKGTSGDQLWLCLCIFLRGGRPIPLCIRPSLLGLLGFPLSPSLFGVDNSVNLIEFLCAWSAECTSFSGTVVSRLVTTLPSSDYLPVY